MKIDRIHHYNIRCAPGDLVPIEKFCGEVLGFRKGYRPDFPNPGIWLYLGDHPIPHVSARCVEGFLQRDHIAFQSQGADDFMAKLERMNIPHERQNLPEAGFQIFLRDPVGTLLEFNFPQHEAPAAVGTGTLAPRQTAIAR